MMRVPIPAVRVAIATIVISTVVVPTLVTVIIIIAGSLVVTASVPVRPLVAAIVASSMAMTIAAAAVHPVVEDGWRHSSAFAVRLKLIIFVCEATHKLTLTLFQEPFLVLV